MARKGEPVEIPQVTKDVGGRIRGLREAKGATQDELAGAMNVSRPNVTAMEGGRMSISVAHLVSAARFLGVPAEDLLPRDVRRPTT